MRAIFLLLIVAIISGCSKSAPPLTSDQSMVEMTRKGKYQEYSSADNDIQKSDIFNKANAETYSAIQSLHERIVNWAGLIDSIATNHGGSNASVQIRSLSGVLYKQVDIQSGSELYKQLSVLKEGQSVVFSGRIVPISNSPISYEASLTESGSLRDPEFLIDLVSISRVSE